MSDIVIALCRQNDERFELFELTAEENAAKKKIYVDSEKICFNNVDTKFRDKINIHNQNGVKLPFHNKCHEHYEIRRIFRSP